MKEETTEKPVLRKEHFRWREWVGVRPNGAGKGEGVGAEVKQRADYVSFCRLLGRLGFILSVLGSLWSI